MASISRSSSAPSHSKVCRRLRATLIRDLPDPQALVERPELRGRFSDYERKTITSQQALLKRAEKLVDVLECSSLEMFEAFVSALRPLKPGLAARLEEEMVGEEGPGYSTGASRERSAQQEVGDRQPRASNQPQVEEDAGVCGLNGFGPDPSHLISDLSYNCWQYLSSELNGTPPSRNTFHSFCQALGVEDRLIQLSTRSGDPTSYMLQKYSQRPEATLERLRQALTDINKPEVYSRLEAMVQEGGGGGGGGGPEDD